MVKMICIEINIPMSLLIHVGYESFPKLFDAVAGIPSQ